MFFPRVKQCTLGGVSPAPVEMTVFCADAPSKKAFSVLSELFPYFQFTEVDTADAATLRLYVVSGISPYAEYYELRIQNAVTDIRAKDYRGLIHAIVTMGQTIDCRDGVFYMTDATVSDHPDSGFRAMLADPSTKNIPMDELRALIINMAKAKMNVLHFHFYDARGSAVKFKAYPDFPEPPGGAYTEEEIRELIDYADRFGVEILPELDIPAHNKAAADWNADLKCKVKNSDGSYSDTVSNWNMCLGSEKTYEVIDTMLAEIAALFPSKYIHIGTDEIELRDLVDFVPPLISHTMECDVCNSFFGPMGIDTLQERFYWFLRRVYKTVSALGKRMMMWNDWIDISKSPDLPRDILIEFWRVAAEQRGPREGCSMQRFLEEGFEVVNADFPNTYVEEYATWEQLKPWDFRRDPADADAYPHRVVGVDMCAWGYSDYEFFKYTIPYAVLAYGDKSRNRLPIEDDAAARRALTRGILGCDVPAEFDLFDYMDGVPLGDAMFKKCVLAENADLDALLATLQSLMHQSRDEKRYAQALISLIHSVQSSEERKAAADSLEATAHA